MKIIAIHEEFDFQDGAQALFVLVGLGRSTIKIPIEPEAAKLLVSIRAAAKGALKPRAVVSGAMAEAPTSEGGDGEEDEEDEQDEDRPIRLGLRDDESL